MANGDLPRFRRIVQLFWDPEPSNDSAADKPVWCLGQKYKLGDHKTAPHQHKTTQQSTPEPDAQAPKDDKAQPTPPPNAPKETKHSESDGDHFSCSLACEEPLPQGSWPQAFIDDFDSRFWMTYRSEFQKIPASTDPKALASLSLAMRIKSTFGDQAGFTSDSGWGCMIRSGQSLLATTLALLRLGRGTHPFHISFLNVAPLTV